MLDIGGLGGLHGKRWIKGGTGEGAQMVDGGFGALKVLNGGREPTGRHPFGNAFKVVLTDTDEPTGTATFGLYFRVCKRGVIDLGCSPYFLGPLPFLPSQEKGMVLIGLLDGQGGETSGIAVPQQITDQATAAGFMDHPGGRHVGSSSLVEMDEDCLDNLTGALRHASEIPGATEHIPLIIEAAHRHGITDNAQIAYILSTVSTETEGVWRPISEYGGHCGQYGSGCFYGRGFTQITWRDNYRRMSDVVGVDLVADPEAALDPEIAAEIIVVGMRDGMFTGQSLDDYIGGGRANFHGARRIINDGDKMQFTANQADRFLAALNSCETVTVSRGPATGEINEAIMDSVTQNEGFSTRDMPRTQGGRLACAGALNEILCRGGMRSLGGTCENPELGVLNVENVLRNGRGVQVDPSEAQPGDIIIVDDGGNKQHTGFCTNAGCTEHISNSSSRAAFSWNSSGWPPFQPSYVGRRVAVYRLTEP
ncbi:MAG: hypothetical protein AAFQ57_13805 [Cyanobacteria bacterium J06626_14]